MPPDRATDPLQFGLIRVAAASPELRIANPGFNADRTLELMAAAEKAGVDLLVFPEMGLTGYTCADLFHTETLRQSASAALDRIITEGESTFQGAAIVGLPVEAGGQLFNAAAVFHGGQLLGIVPKSFLPNYKEFYDARYFSPARNITTQTVTLAGRAASLSPHLLFACGNLPQFVLGVEICEDLWVPTPPSSRQALHGATVIANLSASNEIIGKAKYRRQLVSGQSARCLSGYIYAGAGLGESTTDLVFAGHCLIAENGIILAESTRFQSGNNLIIADLDLDRLIHDRIQTNTFNDCRGYQAQIDSTIRSEFTLNPSPRNPPLMRKVDARPFIPQDPTTLRERCEEIFHIQTAGLAKRLAHIDLQHVAIGVSGGLDSTLALLVVCKTADRLGWDRTRIHALTMPGFGTGTRTLGNAQILMRTLGVGSRQIDIRAMCLEQMIALGHRPFGIALEGETVATLAEKLSRLAPDNRTDLVFENVQARVRTSMLMNSGFVIGTGDLSELALGWCTYNADHMSMYNPNVSIPKTLVQFLVRWAAHSEFDGETRRTLLDVVATDISPELLPIDASGQVTQMTEERVGPYELHDFFLYHFLRFGMAPAKILFLAEHARFARDYSREEVRRWMLVFLSRFFNSQFKRSCLPDGPKVGSVSLSPRGDWRMPSDAEVSAWIEELGEPILP